MNDATPAGNQPAAPTGLALMRSTFPAHHISLLPKPMKKREEMDKIPKGKCDVCGGYHAVNSVMHLEYVGHAAITNRLLDADPNWTWEPVAFGDDGLPRLDKNNGLWIRLTVCGVTRLGYGDAPMKTGGDAMKEAIGDALRNAAMRFGAGLELWHKGDLFLDEEHGDLGDADDGRRPAKEGQQEQKPADPVTYPQAEFKKNLADWSARIQAGKTTADKLIAFIESKAQPLTDDQKKTLKAIKAKPAAQQGA